MPNKPEIIVVDTSVLGRRYSAEKIYAFITIDKDGNEGIAGAHSGLGWMPLVMESWNIVEQVRPLAQQIAEQGKVRVVLRCYEQHTDLETFNPKET